LTAWADRGLTSFTWDVFGGAGPDGPLSSRYEDNVALIEMVKRIRAHTRKLDRESSFNAETNSITGLEWDGEVLDYTWNWICNQVKEGHLTTTTYQEHIDAGPILNVLRSPRVNCNVEGSPLALKQAFADGAYINFLLRKPDGENGSATLSEKPALSAAVTQAAARRRQFLAYFADGVPIGECILAVPSPLFVRAHVHGDRALVIVLNDGVTARPTALELNLGLWLPAGAHRLQRYDADGTAIGPPEIPDAQNGVARLNLGELAPGEMAFVTLE